LLTAPRPRPQDKHPFIHNFWCARKLNVRSRIVLRGGPPQEKKMRILAVMFGAAAVLAVARHSEEEAQRRNRTVDGRRTHPGLRLMQLEAAKVLGRCRIRRAAHD